MSKIKVALLELAMLLEMKQNKNTQVSHSYRNNMLALCSVKITCCATFLITNYKAGSNINQVRLLNQKKRKKRTPLL